MLTQTEFNATLVIRTNPIDKSPVYNHNKVTRRQMYRSYKKEQEVNYTVTEVTALTALYHNSLAPNIKPADCFTTVLCQEGNNPMNYASASISTPSTETQDQRKYLEKRLSATYAELRDPLEAFFGLIDDTPPQSPKEFAERIAEGKFKIRGTGDDEKNATSYRYWDIGSLMIWRDPAKKSDQDGFDAARADLKAKRQAALDIIKIDEPKAGLEAVKALEAWEPTSSAS